MAVQKVTIDTAMLEEIAQICPYKCVQSLCEKLIKKCSFKSSACTSQLCELGYWLYVLGEDELVFRVAEVTHKLTFDCNFNVWSPIFKLWGLEMRLLRERGDTARIEELKSIIYEAHLVPPPVANGPISREQMIESEKQRVLRFSVEDCAWVKQIEAAATPKRKADCKLYALFSLIGLGETGFYPHLNEEKERVEQIIGEYINDLRVYVKFRGK